MLKVLAIADDLTGAAEVAGLARLAGLSVAIVTHLQPAALHDYEVVVLDTHTRACSPRKAQHVIIEHLRGVDVADDTLVFKKTDSVLRGPVVAELQATMAHFGFENALLLPANPSKGRTIVNGTYAINGVPIHLTEFRFDADYPVRSSRVEELLHSSDTLVYLNEPTDAADHHRGKIFTGDVDTTEAIEKLLTRFQAERVLVAGGADCFTALLRGRVGRILQDYDRPASDIARWPRYFFIGSHTTSSAAALQTLARHGSILCQLTSNMLRRPDEGLLLEAWASHRVPADQCVVFARPDERTEGATFGKAITHLLTQVAQRLIERAPPRSHVLVEGGATASELIRRLNWSTLRVEQAYRQGAVSLSVGSACPWLTIKPGSYAWPDEFLR